MINDHHIFVKIKPKATILQGGRLHKWPECSPPFSEHKGNPLRETKHPERVFLAKFDKLSRQYVCIADGFGFKGIREKAITLEAFVPTSGSYGSGSVNVMRKEDIIEVTYEDYKQFLEKIGKPL